MVYKLPQKSREEIAAMFNLSDLNKTRVYQEIQAEVQAEAQAELQKAKQREKAAILRMFNRGLATEEIATFLDLSVAEVEANIAEA
ncbi:hypothetical protein [Planktothricoides raciborskii]|uniref:hypothetical protein n=1 Tax=Planktothricoides raciborskii TaxID=132608 RepID=UPI001F55A30C|nr:hypothetical protein [Planktothricoides raciborskii]